MPVGLEDSKAVFAWRREGVQGFGKGGGRVMGMPPGVSEAPHLQVKTCPRAHLNTHSIGFQFCPNHPATVEIVCNS